VASFVLFLRFVYAHLLSLARGWHQLYNPSLNFFFPCPLGGRLLDDATHTFQPEPVSCCNWQGHRLATASTATFHRKMKVLTHSAGQERIYRLGNELKLRLGVPDVWVSRHNASTICRRDTVLGKKSEGTCLLKALACQSFRDPAYWYRAFERASVTVRIQWIDY